MSRNIATTLVLAGLGLALDDGGCGTTIEAYKAVCPEPE
jgi:hypothetical protein